MKLRQTIVTGLLGALLLAVQVSLSMLPNIELVSLLVMLYAMEFPPKVSFGAVYVFVLLEGLFYGFGSWWPGYLYIWAVAAAAALLLRKNDSALFWAVISAIYGLCFGGLYALSYMIAGGFWYGVSWWISGLLFDLLHCGGNFVLMLALYRPLRTCFSRLGQRFLV